MRRLSPSSGSRPARLHACGAQAFTFTEILLVIAIIGIMSAIVLTTVGNATQDSRLTVARQQQVALQTALNAWIAGQASTNTISTVRSTYTAATDKLTLLTAYLGSNSVTFSNSSNQVRTDALQKSGKYLTFSTWTTNTFPIVNMLP